YAAVHLPGGRHFDKVFGTYWWAGQGAQELWVQQRGGQTLVVLGVDLSLRRHDLGSYPLGFLGCGRAYPKRLEQLCSLTRQARSRYAGCAVLWVIHFEPAARNPLLELLDERHLATALKQDPADAILCGHTHDSNLARTYEGIPVFVC